jgi:hypothetical protein
LARSRCNALPSSNHDFTSEIASFIRRRPVKYKFRYLSALNAGAICALGAALELEGDAADRRLGHTFLAKIAQLAPVEDRAGRVKVLGLDLYGVLEVDVEGVARTVGKELGVVLGEDAAEPLELDADIVVGRARGASVQPEADDEDSLIDAELDGVATAPVTPLVRSVCA